MNLSGTHFFNFSPQCTCQWSSYQNLAWLQSPAAQPENSQNQKFHVNILNNSVNVRRSETGWPCELLGQSRSWTSLDQSACIWTQTALSSTALGFAHKSDKERKRNHTDLSRTTKRLTQSHCRLGSMCLWWYLGPGLPSLWRHAGVKCPVSGVVFMVNIPHSWAPVRGQWLGPEGNQAPVSWWGHAGCSTRQPRQARRRRGDPSAVPWETNRKMSGTQEIISFKCEWLQTDVKT